MTDNFDIILSACVTIFFIALFASVAHSEVRDAEVLTVCLQAGHTPADCAVLTR